MLTALVNGRVLDDAALQMSGLVDVQINSGSQHE